MVRTFLTARWSDLVLINYAVSQDLVKPYLPPGCVADASWDGRAYVSLVGFDFLDCRVLGVKWPGLVNFPEVNLRAYVRHEASGDRGVVFVRELVSSKLIAWIARMTYNEPYRATPMRSSVRRESGVQIRHEVQWADRTHWLEAEGEPCCEKTSTSALACHFKEHRWGFGRSRRGQLMRYEVIHPLWRCHPVRSLKLDWDFGAVYGSQWAFLNHATPDSIVIAEGSGVEVKVWRREE